MPVRPHLSARPLRTIRIHASPRPSPVPSASCLTQRPDFLRYHLRPGQQQQPHSRRQFHTTPLLRDDVSSQTHYETLSLSPSATAAEIKRSYFTLSKKYHPDHNPNDPTASSRFVQISEAYHVLGVAEKRAQYDRQLGEAQGRGRSRGGAGPAHGSYSSHQTYAGSRPASGLNKKRSTFRGPPPSFYASGGYGRHGAKRAEYQHYNPHSGFEKPHEAPPENDGDGFGAGFGPGQTSHGYSVPHFDDIRHKKTHETLHEHIQSRRRKRRKFEIPENFDPRTSFSSFVMIAGALTMIGLLARGLHWTAGENPRERKKREARSY
jgi:curved DNA-binding protein CbpA